MALKTIQKAAAADAFIEMIADRVAERVLERINHTTPSGDTRLLTLKEAGGIIGRSAGAVAQLIQRGEFTLCAGSWNLNSDCPSTGCLMRVSTT